MRDLFNTAFLLVSFVVTAGFALMVVGLGYLFMSFALNFGWGALIILIIFIALLGLVERSIEAVIFAPVTLIRAALSKGRPPEPSTQDKRGANLVSLSIGLLMVVGAILATLQYIIQGLLN